MIQQNSTVQHNTTNNGTTQYNTKQNKTKQYKTKQLKTRLLLLLLLCSLMSQNKINTYQRYFWNSKELRPPPPPPRSYKCRDYFRWDRSFCLVVVDVVVTSFRSGRCPRRDSSAPSTDTITGSAALRLGMHASMKAGRVSFCW